jgi:hypothetical protein
MPVSRCEPGLRIAITEGEARYTYQVSEICSNDSLVSGCALDAVRSRTPKSGVNTLVVWVVVLGSVASQGGSCTPDRVVAPSSRGRRSKALD